MSAPGGATAAPAWTTLEQIKAEIERRWRRGDLPREAVIAALGLRGDAAVTGTGHGELPPPLFPLEVRLKRPTPRELADRFGDVMRWIDALRKESRDGRGFGYELRWERVNNRVHGANELPAAAVFPTREDALRLIRRQSEAARLGALARAIVGRRPELLEWVVRHPHSVLEHEEKWERLLAVVDWFAAHPRPGLYLRQLDIRGVDSKFIEAHRGVLTELLDAVLPPEAIDASATGIGAFAARYGLKQEAPMIRFRLLDPKLYIRGLSDLAVLSEEFAELDVTVKRVFITENRTNGLAFPPMPDSIVIFGLGYGVDRLAEVPWLRETEVWYWGDIDTHGFGILNRLRAKLPSARSFLMDRATLMAHRELWVEEPEGKRFTGEPALLTPDEYALFDDLRCDRLGTRVRLEQERIAWSWLNVRLREIAGS